MEDFADKLARDLLRLDDLDGASRIAEDELGRVEDRGNNPETWRLRFVRAEIIRLRGHTEEALKYLEARASVYAPEASDAGSVIGLLMHSGYCCGLLGRYQRSHLLLAEAQEKADHACLPELLCEVYQRQAMIFFRQKDYVSSDRIFRAILKLADDVGGWYFRGNALWGIGKNLMIQERYRDAMPWLQESLEVFEGVNARLSLATVWSELAVCHLGLGDDDTALELFQKAAQRDIEAGAIHNYQVALANIGNVYLHRRDYLTAISYYRQAVTFAREIGDPLSIKKWTYNINLAYARIRQSVDEKHPRTA
jgi:tetratricopeptide (TPR) repeat protein